MSLRAFLVLAVASGLLAAAASGASTPPPGATALCRDGTYSFSQTHSGTCSHHGGVARWLDGTAGPGAVGAPAAVSLGTTLLISPRTKTSHCKLGPDPDRACSPGAYYSRLTKAVLCSSSFHTSSIRNVSESEKFAVEAEYGLKPGHYGSALEIDHIVSLELGGSNDIANLYPEKLDAGPGYRVKDRLENRLHAMVCAGTITLHAAQVGIATNWQALYKRIFGTQ
jgi:Protein of unknown function (DUF3761)